MPNLSELAFAKENLLQCKGYDPKFIHKTKPVDAEKILSKKLKELLPVVEGEPKGILHYTGMSVHFNAKRKVPFFAAYNIDGGEKQSKATRPKFRQDSRMKATEQLDFPFYDLEKNFTEFEIGHMASNNEMGRGKEGKVKAFQTFHFTNSVPQAEKLNSGIWKGLESYIIKEAATSGNHKKICVFTGPLLKTIDPKYVNMPSFKIPILFFKVIVFRTSKGLFSTAFMMSHEKKMIDDGLIDTGPEALEEGPFSDFKFKKVFQVDIDLLEEESGLNFTWPNVKKIDVPDVINQVKKIKSIRDAKEADEAIKEGSIESISKKLKPNQKIKAKMSIKKGLVPEALLSDADLTPKELKQKKFKLNILLS